MGACQPDIEKIQAGLVQDPGPNLALLRQMAKSPDL